MQSFILLDEVNLFDLRFATHDIHFLPFFLFSFYVMPLANYHFFSTRCNLVVSASFQQQRRLILFDAPKWKCGQKPRIWPHSGDKMQLQNRINKNRLAFAIFRHENIHFDSACSHSGTVVAISTNRKGSTTDRKNKWKSANCFKTPFSGYSAAQTLIL